MLDLLGKVEEMVDSRDSQGSKQDTSCELRSKLSPKKIGVMLEKGGWREERRSIYRAAQWTARGVGVWPSALAAASAAAFAAATFSAVLAAA